MFVRKETRLAFHYCAHNSTSENFASFLTAADISELVTPVLSDSCGQTAY
jgi:hypothetical protein